MKKSDLRAIILEELEKSNQSLLMEKFASSIIADINRRISVNKWNKTASNLWTATANTYGIAWDKVKDEHVSTGANPRRDMLNIFFVAAGTENPYGDRQSYYDSGSGKRYGGPDKFGTDGLLGITVGKKVIGFSGKTHYKDPAATKRSKKVDTNADNYSKADVGSGVDRKVWNYKRMLEISSEVFSIDISAVRDWNVELKSLRSDQKDGAIAMQMNADILKDNKSRYSKALKDLKDAGVEGKEFDIVLAHLDDAEKILTKELKQKIKDTRKGIVYPGWDNPFELAVNLHKNMVDKFKDFQRYSKSAKKEGGSWYEQYLTDIAHDVTDIKKDFDKRLARAVAQGPVEITESVLPVYEGNAFLGARAKAIEEDLEEFEFNGKIYPVTKKVNEEYIESMDSMALDKHLSAIEMQWLDWKRGPLTEPSDIKPAQKELKGFIEDWFKKTIR
jgi:hypothetical protein